MPQVVWTVAECTDIGPVIAAVALVDEVVVALRRTRQSGDKVEHVHSACSNLYFDSSARLGLSLCMADFEVWAVRPLRCLTSTTGRRC